MFHGNAWPFFGDTVSNVYQTGKKIPLSSTMDSVNVAGKLACLVNRSVLVHGSHAAI